MGKLTNDQRSAILSARAKNRKAATALANGEVTVPKAIVAHMRAVEDWTNKLLAPAKKAQPKADPSETYDADAPDEAVEATG